jgi:hypothetical protein
LRDHCKVAGSVRSPANQMERSEEMSWSCSPTASESTPRMARNAVGAVNRLFTLNFSTTRLCDGQEEQQAPSNSNETEHTRVPTKPANEAQQPRCHESTARMRWSARVTFWQDGNAKHGRQPANTCRSPTTTPSRQGCQSAFLRRARRCTDAAEAHR